MARRLAFTFLLVLLVGICFGKDKKKDPDEIGNRDVGKGINFYSIEKEMALGRQLAIEVEREAKMVDDAIVGEYVNRLGQNLARNSDAKMPVTFKIIDSDSVNAFTLPGGHVFVNSGLIRVAETEAELAGAVAHEIAHVAARHLTRQMTRAEITNLATMPLVFWGGWWGYAARQGSGLGIPLAFLSFSRAFEGEADLLGLEYMFKAGYDPNASIDIFERIESLEKRRPGTVAKVFSTHPMTADRIRMAQKNINEILPGRAEYVVNTSEFNEMRARVIATHQHQKRQAEDPAKPTLRQGSDGDDRPTLQRRLAGDEL
ncbi:MAG TPA: M48 family metallopeptidase [Bryobacteraceae bacterium]|jgi:predicted Zn-dependent protease|nr:M48 family metallopeptidase [Bryobacteraceae bacterium]